MSNTERRFVTSEFEVRSEGTSTTIRGYAAKFNKDSQNLGGFVERIAPGAFKKTIKEADVRALFNHDPSRVLGRNASGTLRLSEDSTGLEYEVDLDLGNTDHANLHRMIERGDVSQSSFGFNTIKDSWEYNDEETDDPVVRTLHEVRLFDVSPVTYPAYLDTEVDVARSLASLAETADRDLDELVGAATRGELRSFLLTPSTEVVEPATSHSQPPSTLHVPRRLADDKRRWAQNGAA